MKIYNKINKSWKKYPSYFWGDYIDVRYYLCNKLQNIKNKRILDLACGSGVIISTLDKSNNIYGVEIDDQRIQNAKTLNPHANIIKGDIFNLDFKEKFDVIILANVLPKHDYKSNKTPKELIGYIKQFLRPNGAIHLTTPNSDNTYYRKTTKFVNEEYLKNLFQGFNYKMRYWNPFPIQLHKILKFLPFIFDFLESISNIRNKSCVSFYCEISLKNKFKV